MGQCAGQMRAGSRAVRAIQRGRIGVKSMLFYTAPHTQQAHHDVVEDAAVLRPHRQLVCIGEWVGCTRYMA